VSESFDLIILGSGPGGYVAAIRASQLGMKVAIVERERLGGICLNWGCIPTKALLRTSEIYHYMQHAGDYGLSATNVGFDLAKVTERSRKVAAQLNGGVKGLMKKHKVTVVEGTGTLASASEIKVTTGDQTRTLTAPNIIIATGARARDLPGVPADGKRIWTYRHAMVPPEMPTNLLVIGSGAIGVEFASFYSDMGAKVTVVEMLDRILPVEDEEVSAFMEKALTKQGMRILTATKVSDVKPGAEKVTATITTADGKASTEAFSHVIVAIGIVPNTETSGWRLWASPPTVVTSSMTAMAAPISPASGPSVTSLAPPGLPTRPAMKASLRLKPSPGSMFTRWTRPAYRGAPIPAHRSPASA
jgi:dihydrolipoamide dehydrogenase